MYLCGTLCQGRRRSPVRCRPFEDYLYSERDTTTGNPQYDSYGIYRTDYSAKPVLAGIRTANAT